MKETSLTFIENALIKARYSGKDASDRQNVDKLLTALASVLDGQHSAQFHCVLVYLCHADDLTPLVCHSSWSGEIARQPFGTDSFGWDPVFLLTEQSRTAADLNAEEKQMFFYCGQALACLLDALYHA